MHIPLLRSIMVQIDSCQFASSEQSEKLVYFTQVSGKVTYNGHEMHEFVPQRTCAYISQRDLQMGELTVRETLDFSGRCQGVGPNFGEQIMCRNYLFGLCHTQPLNTIMWDNIKVKRGANGQGNSKCFT